MPKYKINITPELSEIVEADSIEDAKKIVKAQIAKGAISPIYDKLYFDYDTGVKDLKLRRKLARAEITKPEEQDAVLRKFVGSDGFTRTTDGQLALTPTGLRNLGETVQTKTLLDGSTVEQNTIVDSTSWFERGDLADFMGVTGPIVGTIAALLPAGRALNTLKALGRGSQQAGQVVAAAGGSAVGKGVEEIADAVEGFQLQDKSELTRLLGMEAALGASGEGISAAAGVLWRAVFGAAEPTSNLRLLFNAGKGRSLTDLKKLDLDFGREATESEIKKAIAEGKINVFDDNFAAAFASMGRTIPGRAQQISESVLGVKRDKGNIAYLSNELNNISKNFREQDALLNKYIDQTTKSGIDADLGAFSREIDIAANESVKETTRAVKELADAYIGIGSYRNAPPVRGYGENILKLLGDAKSQVDRNVRKKYNAADAAFVKLETNPAVKDAIQETVDFYADAGLREIDNFKVLYGLEDGVGLSAKGDDINFQNLLEIERRLQTLKRPIERTTRGVAEIGQEFAPVGKLTQVRNIDSKIRNFIGKTSKSQPEREVFIKIQRLLDDTRYHKKKGIDLATNPDKANSILSTLAAPAGRVFGKLTNQLDNTQIKQINDSVKLLRKANNTAAELNIPFDNATIAKIVNSARISGAYDPDDIFNDLIIKGTTRQTEDFFAALKDYDDYLIKTNRSADATNLIDAQKATLQRLFASAIDDAIDPVNNVIDNVKFAKYFKKIENDNPGQLAALFRDANGVGSGARFLETINQLVKISPRLKPNELSDLVKVFRRNESQGLSTSQVGTRFINALENQAEISAKQLDFAANKAISDLPNKTPDQIVDVIFRPKNQNNINQLKNILEPEQFKKVQEASLGKLLEKSIDLGYTGKTPITDIFKAGNLRTALDSYGDETLTAMFGKEFTTDINVFANNIDILTKGEIGRGNFPGSLVAAGIAAGIAFAPLATLPTVLGLSVLRFVLGNPAAVKLFTKTDKGSIRQLLDIVATATQQATVRGVASAIQSANVEAQRALAEIDTSDLAQQLRDSAEELRTPQAPVPSIELPEVAPVQNQQIFTPEEQARRQFAEDLFRRPVI